MTHFYSSSRFLACPACSSFGLTYVEQLMSFGFFRSLRSRQLRTWFRSKWGETAQLFLACLERVKLLAFLKWMRFLAAARPGKTAEATHSRPGTVRLDARPLTSKIQRVDVKDPSVCCSGRHRRDQLEREGAKKRRRGAAGMKTTLSVSSALV